MKKYYRSDLACDVAAALSDVEGTEHSKRSERLCTVESLQIKTEEASARLARPIGSYVTLFTSEIWLLDDGELSELSLTLSRELRGLLLRSCGVKSITRDYSLLIVGLGNSSITADAIGPLTAEGIVATRHIRSHAPEIFEKMHTCIVSALIPGVLGKTGIESAETVRSAIKTVKPDALIVVDALAAGSIDRLATTVQLSNTGINPGAGIGNLRSELSYSTLGVPVISIGVPTVVDSSTLVCDALMRAGIEKIPNELVESLDRGVGYYVTPKETDVISEKVARLISAAISSALVI